MPQSTLSALLLLLFFVLLFAHLFGTLFACLRQPRVIGEIAAGILIALAMPHRLAAPLAAAEAKGTLEFLYQLGLLLLMFLSGAEVQSLFSREDRRLTSWLALVGTGMPFLCFLGVLLLAGVPLGGLIGPAQSRVSLVLVLGIAVAVTSIPVISRIFHDLGILGTRFARIVLSVAVFEDVALWAVLAVATALAADRNVPASTIAKDVAVTLVYLVAGLAVLPRLLARVHEARWNIWGRQTPVAHLLLLALAYLGTAALLHVNLVFSAFLAGIAAPRRLPRFAAAMEALHSVSFALFIPVYFALVGFRLDLRHTFAWRQLALFLAVACALKLASVFAGARLAGLRGLGAVNLAVATNARGGPGIVLASVAFGAGIISATLYTTLVLTAILTSQAAGWWLDFVLRRGWPLLPETTGTVHAGAVLRESA